MSAFDVEFDYREPEFSATQPIEPRARRSTLALLWISVALALTAVGLFIAAAVLGEWMPAVSLGLSAVVFVLCADTARFNIKLERAL